MSYSVVSLVDVLVVFFSWNLLPLFIIRQHLSYDDRLEDKRKDYQNCSVLYCIAQLCTVVCTLIWTVLID